MNRRVFEVWLVRDNLLAERRPTERQPAIEAGGCRRMSQENVKIVSRLSTLGIADTSKLLLL